MRVQLCILIAVIAVVLVGCGKDSMPYKSLADTRPSTPTGNVVGVQKEVVKTSEFVETKTDVPVSNEQSNTFACKDSDYGKMVESQGVVSGIAEDGSSYEMRDACIGDNVYEYYCDGNNPKVMQDKCPRGCKNGFCI